MGAMSISAQFCCNNIKHNNHREECSRKENERIDSDNLCIVLVDNNCQLGGGDMKRLG